MPKSPRSPRRWRRQVSSWLFRAPTARRSNRCCRRPNTSSAIRTWSRMMRSTSQRRNSSSTSCSAPATTTSTRGRAARQGAGLQQRRRERHFGVRARHHADAHGVAPGDLAARERLGRPLARQRRGADDVRSLRQDARHRRARHHRQEGGAARAAPSACGCSTTTSRGCPSTRRTRSACASGCFASCCELRHRHHARAAQRFDRVT